MEYYFTDGVSNFGPFTLEQLREKNITAQTRVWYSGLSGWTPASEIPELAGILVTGTSQAAPPPVNPASFSGQGYYQNRPPKTWLVESILVTLLCCMPFGIAGIIYASRVESKFYAGDRQGAERASLEAGKWTKIGFWSGLAIGVLAMIFYIILIAWIVKNEGGCPTDF